MNDFMQEPVLAALEQATRKRLAKRLTVRSNWFMLAGRVESDNGRFELSSLLYADPRQSGVSVVSRKYGGAW